MNPPPIILSPQRLPRYRRAAAAPGFRVTERDARIIELVYRLRFPDRPQISRLEFSPGATSSAKKRLTLLYHHGYLDRRYAPQAAPSGSAAALYCLDRKGAELLASRQGLRVADLDWKRQENDKDTFFLAHHVATNDVYIAFALACRRRALPLEWLDERSLRRDLTSERQTAATGRSIFVPIPDGHALVEHEGQDYAFAVELDRGTVEEKRIRQKIEGYGAWAASASYSKRFPDASLRVLFVVDAGAASASRLQRLKHWTELENGRSLFWFADRTSLLEQDILADRVWQVAGQSQSQSLLNLPQNRVLIRTGRRLPELH